MRHCWYGVLNSEELVSSWKTRNQCLWHCQKSEVEVDLLLSYSELPGLCFKMGSNMEQIMSVPKVKVQKQHGQVPVNTGRWYLYKL